MRDLGTSASIRTEYTQALEAMLALRIIQPSLVAFRSNTFKDYPAAFRLAQEDADLDQFFAAVDAVPDTTPHFQRWARFDVCCALTTQGIRLRDLTPEAFLYYAKQTREEAMSAYSIATYVGHLAWRVLHEMGQFPRSAPPTLRAALRAPKMTPTELIDQYGLANQDVRSLLIAYLDRRQAELDYVSLAAVAQTLAVTFWKTVESINPDQPDLRLSDEVYQQWRTAISVTSRGTERLSTTGVLTAIRALYFDLQAWAVHEPEVWARWSVPCPIKRSDMRANSKRLRRARERTHDTVRTLQPLLPHLVDHVTNRYTHTKRLLDRARSATADEVFAIDGTVYRRLFTAADRRRELLHGQANIRVEHTATGKAVNVSVTEDTAFWAWAIVETLRLSGLRCEELLELSQLSIRQYQRPNGEVIALLVVAPSKTDRERVIPMTAELFHVVASIIKRLSKESRTIPLATRFDEYERVTTDPQPFLFQRRIGQRNEVMTHGAVSEMLRRICAEAALVYPALEGHNFRPHDFRRLFATDLVNHGLPIHIGAALLGHLNLETTRGYVAVFEEDVVRHYQTHLQRRRTLRPTTEYRSPTSEEWQEFEEHFDLRKLELGNCGRPYGTPCTHEHACIRCPMLELDPDMLPRLDEIETDLLSRRERATAEQWRGEVEGIDLTLNYLRGKRHELLRSNRRAVDLGVPTLAPAHRTPDP